MGQNCSKWTISQISGPNQVKALIKRAIKEDRLGELPSLDLPTVKDELRKVEVIYENSSFR